jgi:hypothetical protein
MSLMALQALLLIRHAQYAGDEASSSEGSTSGSGAVLRNRPVSPHNPQPLDHDETLSKPIAVGAVAIAVAVAQQGEDVVIQQQQQPRRKKAHHPPGKGDVPEDFDREGSLSIDTPHADQLPDWIRNYIHWHRETLKKYPGDELFENPDAPNVLIRTCLGLCGGLHDRLGQLPWDLYLANQTNRILFIKWERPKALENFLIPNEIPWSLPTTKGFEEIRAVRAHKEFFQGYLDDHPEEAFWKTELDASIARANTGEFKDIKVLRHRILGHLDEKVLEQRLKDLGETDMIHWTPSFGHIFWAFFKASPGVQTELDKVYDEFNISPGHYSAVHCRVRHPKATPSNVYIIGKSNSHPADKSGLPWYGDNRDFAVTVATKAVYCARTLVAEKEPIYFFSDSNDLVRYMAHELSSPLFLKANSTLLVNATDVAARKAIEPISLIAREMTQENAHIDRQKGREAIAYFGTFVDFLLATNARCVTYGIGYYAIFAVKISGISCKLVYQEEEWGGREGTKIAPKCTNETYKHLL